MIDVKVLKAFVSPGFLRKHNIRLPHTFQLPEGTTGKDLMVHLELNPQTPTLFAVNDKVVPLTHPLNHGDEVEIHYPIGGG